MQRDDGNSTIFYAVFLNLNGSEWFTGDTPT